MKPVDIKSNIYIDFRSEINDKNQKIKIADNVRISKYKKVFKKGYSPNRSGEGFVTKVKNTVPWTSITNHLNGEKIVETFYENKLQKPNQKEPRIFKK